MSYVGAPIGMTQQHAGSAANVQYTSPSVYNVTPEQFAILAAGGKLTDEDVNSIMGSPNPVMVLDTHQEQAELMSGCASSPCGNPEASTPGPSPDVKSSSKSKKKKRKAKTCC